MNKTCFCGISEHCGYQIETDMEQHDKVIYEEGYNKAIDEFAERMKELSECGEISVFGWNRIVDEIAEQLKGGAE